MSQTPKRKIRCSAFPFLVEFIRLEAGGVPAKIRCPPRFYNWTRLGACALLFDFVFFPPAALFSLPTALLLLGLLITMYFSLRIMKKNMLPRRNWHSSNIRKTDTSVPEREPDESGGTVKWTINERKSVADPGRGPEPPPEAGG